MQLFWGSYGFPVNQAEVTTRTTTIRGDNRRELRRVMSATVKATLDGATQSELSIAELACRDALSIPYLDLVLRQDDGSASATKLLNQTSLSGVRIVDGPHFPDAMSPEYVNSRTVTFTAEAEYIVTGSENAIIAWEETLSVVGNGMPGYVMRRPFNADPFPQRVSPSTPIITTQSGRAVGHTRYPDFPTPMFGLELANGFIDAESFVQNKKSPKAIGRAWIEYAIEWSYKWVHVGLLSGNPKLPPLF